MVAGIRFFAGGSETLVGGSHGGERNSLCALGNGASFSFRQRVQFVSGRTFVKVFRRLRPVCRRRIASLGKVRAGEAPGPTREIVALSRPVCRRYSSAFVIVAGRSHPGAALLSASARAQQQGNRRRIRRAPPTSRVMASFVRRVRA